MSEDGEEQAETGLVQELSELWNAARPLLRRLPR